MGVVAADGYTYDLFLEENGYGKKRYAIYRHMPQTVPTERVKVLSDVLEHSKWRFGQYITSIDKAIKSEYRATEKVKV